MKDYYSMLPEWAKDIPELRDVCAHTSPEQIADKFKHFIAFNEDITSIENRTIKAEIIEGMFQRLNVTPEQIRKAIIESVIEWN